MSWVDAIPLIDISILRRNKHAESMSIISQIAHKSAINFILSRHNWDKSSTIIVKSSR